MSYRVQLSYKFTFLDLLNIMDYLNELGVEWIYLSPILQARKGSEHGYDVYDFSKVNEELGGLDLLMKVSAKAKELGMKILVDVVPNHMTLENPYLMDVLKNGRNSKYSKYFDWDGEKIILPILGEELNDAIKSMEIKDGFLHYYDHVLPLNVGSESSNETKLTDLLKHQNYILEYWKNSSKEINYRRFFDVNSLIGLRQEDPEVFEDTHKVIFSLVKQGVIQGIRVDHPDGLFDPKRYFEQLRERVGGVLIQAEKILSGHERLRDWKIDGTTGYDFLRDVNMLFVEKENKFIMERIYEEFTGESLNYERSIWKSKEDVIEELFKGDIDRIAKKIEKITGKDYRKEIKDFIKCMRVYRTYISDHVEWDDIEAIAKASECSGPGVLDLVNNRSAMMYLQQLESPIMAKGLEDTFFYRYNPLISLNEVGGDPWTFGITCEEFHARNLERELFRPNTMTTLSTHDTKFSEDVRARINVLSEIPLEWEVKVKEWAAINEKFKISRGRFVYPTKNDEFRFYQVLLGTWKEYSEEYEERLVKYMMKAIREEKNETSWLFPNDEYEKAVEKFVRNVIKDGEFLRSFLPFYEKIKRIGEINSISQKTLQLTSPGIPDIYQGNETFTFLMVDPDNRRPVDFDHLKKELSEIKREDPRKMTMNRLKTYIVWKLLELRRRRRELFKGYTPVNVSGDYSKRLCVFSRNGLVTVAPRLIANNYPLNMSRINIDLDGEYEDILTGDVVDINEALRQLPVAVLVKR
ncbi:malto-oligosyltrehalose synthase [Candidatus Acidianus copahuensis]|nr:malto-oligosyltrehalose synthase [Candidatus Acidianus copahuensis]